MDRTRFGASRCAETTGISVKSSSWKENSLIASDLLLIFTFLIYICFTKDLRFHLNLPEKCYLRIDSEGWVRPGPG